MSTGAWMYTNRTTNSWSFESNFSAGEPELYRTALISIDSKRTVSRQLHQEIEALCREDGFRVISREGFNRLRAEGSEIEDSMDR